MLFKRERPEFTHYIALGDSLSTDDYPGENQGAASLLYRNQDQLFPDSTGLDLISLFPGMQFQPLAQDGATTSDVIREQIPKIQFANRERVLFTLTAGGNDILSEQDHADHIASRIQTILQTLQQQFPSCLILVATVYDPTDGGGDLFEPGKRLDHAMKTLSALNQNIRSMEASAILVADIHKYFLGHGAKCKDPENRSHHPDDPSLWYLLSIEPNARGAHEIRKLFWEKFIGAGARQT